VTNYANKLFHNMSTTASECLKLFLCLTTLNYEMTKAFIKFVKKCVVSLHKSYWYRWHFCIRG